MTPSDRLKQARQRAGFSSAAAAATALGVPYSTYSQHENGTRPDFSKHAVLYGRRFGVTPEWLLFGRNPGDTTPAMVKINREIPVLGAVQAGLFAPIPDEPEIEAMVPLVLPGFESASLYALRVMGESMNLYYPSGTLVVVCPVQEYGLPRDGDHVIVRHYRNGMAETTVKEVRQEKEGVSLWPRSSDPAFSAPARITRQCYSDEGYEIIAVVVSAYTVRPVQRKPLIRL